MDLASKQSKKTMDLGIFTNNNPSSVPQGYWL